MPDLIHFPFYQPFPFVVHITPYFSPYSLFLSPYMIFSCLTIRESDYCYFTQQILAKYLCFCFHSNLNCFGCQWKPRLDVGIMESLLSNISSIRYFQTPKNIWALCNIGKVEHMQFLSSPTLFLFICEIIPRQQLGWYFCAIS